MKIVDRGSVRGDAIKNFKGSIYLVVPLVANGHLSYVDWQGQLPHCYRAQPELPWLWSRRGRTG